MTSILQSEKFLLLACAIAMAGYAADARLADYGRVAGRSRPQSWSRPSWPRP